MTAADPPLQAGPAPGGTKAPQPRHRESWPGRRPLVWAPRAHTVDVVLPQPDGTAERRPLRLVGAQEPGYWRADADLAVGTDYAFSVDGGSPVPDPCSTQLPHGLHGPGRVLDETFRWTDGGWRGADLRRGALLHLDIPTATAAGTLDAAAELLPATAALGVAGVELSPLAAFDPDLGPAAGVRLFAVHEPYGGPAALQRFVDAAHAAGLAVVLDLPHRWAVADALGLHAFGPYAVGSRIGPRPGSPWDADTPRINLDGSGSRGPRDFLVADATRWLTEFHVDGLLLDVEVLTDRSAVPFLGELADAVQSVGAHSGVPRTLLTDGRGLSDRLTTIIGHLLAGELVGSAAALERLADELDREVTPGAAVPAGRRLRGTPRTASTVVGDLTRLPAAGRAVPWSDPDGELVTDTAADDRAALLAFAVMAGSPVVLDTEHVPVQGDRHGDRRLVSWARALLTLRPSTLKDLDSPVDLTVDGDVLIGLRGDSALVLAVGPEDAEVDLTRHLPPPSGVWQVATSWDVDRTHLLAGRLQVPARAAVVLRREDAPATADGPGKTR
ncbi:alpha-amylase family protein [Isoptericola aurantiacus]|uniref:hypothetical protein n=1 Tax=Isoptericola aurantiacus TaxID=3377839 RepID=UPI003839FE56